MAKFEMSGANVDRPLARRLGVLAVATAITIGLVSFAATTLGRGSDDLELNIVVSAVGDGIEPETQVLLDGIRVGTVTTIRSEENRRRVVTISVDAERIRGLNSGFTLAYAPINIFGVSGLEIKHGGPGAPLQNDQYIDLSDTVSNRVQDNTLAVLIDKVSQTTHGVLTPEAISALTSASSDLQAFTPLVESIVAVGRTIAETQRLPSSFLIEQYASALEGGEHLLGSTIDMVNTINRIDILRTNKPLFDAGVSLFLDNLFPSLTTLGTTAQTQLGDTLNILTPILSTTARSIPQPQVTSSQLSEILDRLDRSFTETPNGPALDLKISLADVPAVAQPLAAITPETQTR